MDRHCVLFSLSQHVVKYHVKSKKKYTHTPRNVFISFLSHYAD